MGCKSLSGQQVTVKYACAGEQETLNVTGWNNLPYDLAEVVLANLSPHELACISTTSSTFRAVCRKRLAQEHKARVDIAAGCVGRERFLYIALILDRFLKLEAIVPDVPEHDKDANWVLLRENVGAIAVDRVYQVGDLKVTILLGDVWRDLVVHLPTVKGPLVRLEVSRYSMRHFNISVFIIGEGQAMGIVEGTAFLQALLSGCLAPLSPDSGLPRNSSIVKYFFDDGCGSGRKGLRTQIAPLAPHTTFAVLGVGGASIVKEHLQVRRVRGCDPVFLFLADWSAKTKLHVTCCVEPPPQARRGFFQTILHYIFNS
jgi:hypothetical protein